jgi:hypothetical protein
VTRAQLAGALLVSVALTALLGRVQLLPPGPATDYAEVGEGSDLDIQLEMAWVASSYGPGSVAWWDPYPDFGQPLIANAEAFVGHPGFLLGGEEGDPQRGVLWMYRVQLLVLLLGACWLASGLGLPWWTGPPLMLPLLASPEWQERIGMGHLMILGLSAVPAALAGWHGGLVAAAEGRRARGLVVGALGGGAVGLGSLAGGHYPTAFTLFALLLASWGWLAGPRFAAALGALVALPWLLPSSLAEVTPLPVELAVFAVLGAGLWAGRRCVPAAATPLLGFGAGLLAVAGWRLVPSFVVVKLNWRASSWRTVEVEPIPFAAFLGGGEGEGGIETLLRAPAPGLLLVAVLGVVVLTTRLGRPPGPAETDPARAAREGTAAQATAAVAFAVLVCVLLGWSAGRPLHPWRVATLAPGMSAINYPLRLQWFLLILPGFGLLAAATRASVTARLPRALVPALVSAWLVWTLLDRAQLDPYPAAAPVDIGASERVRGVRIGGDDATLSRTSMQGWVRPRFATGIGFGLLETPPHEDASLGHGEEVREPGEQTPARSAADVTILGVRDTWTVTAPPGSQVRVAQRDLRGWRCDGGTQVTYPNDDALRVPTPLRGNNWLRIEVGPTGTATCRWRPPGLWVGIALQLLAAVALAGAALRR